MEPVWIVHARAFIGQKEIPGRDDNPWIVSLWRAIKRGGIKTESVPWCAAFVGAMLEQCGIISTRFESAKSYLTWGSALAAPTVGCVVVFEREGGGHVGLVVGQTKTGDLLVLGGNQGDAVNIKAFGRERVAGYRWPSEIPMGLTVLPIGAAEVSRSEA